MERACHSAAETDGAAPKGSAIPRKLGGSMDEGRLHRGRGRQHPGSGGLDLPRPPPDSFGILERHEPGHGSLLCNGISRRLRLVTASREERASSGPTVAALPASGECRMFGLLPPSHRKRRRNGKDRNERKRPDQQRSHEVLSARFRSDPLHPFLARVSCWFHPGLPIGAFGAHAAL